MAELIIANSIAPIIITREGGIFIFFSIIPVEMLVIWLILQPSIPRLFIGVLVANIASSIIGIPFVFMVSNSNLVESFVLFGFLSSFLIESAIYRGFFKQKSCLKIIVASFVSNVVSYAICAIFIVPFSFNSDVFSVETSPRMSATIAIGTWLRKQEMFYIENSHFASSSWFYIENYDFASSSESEYFRIWKRSYKFEMQSEPQKASIVAIPKRNIVAIPKRNDLPSLRGTIFIIKDKDKLNFIKGICKTDKPSMTPPEMPQLVKGEFQCPPGSLDISDQFGLRQR